MCCACATSKRIFVRFVFHSVHCLMLLLFQFCYSKCCFYATPTGYIFIEYKSYEKKTRGKRRGKKAPQSNIQTSIIVVQVTPKSKSISLLFMSLLIQLFIQYEVRNQEWKRTKMEWERERGKGSEDKNEATAMMIMIKETNVWPFFQSNRAQTPFHKIIVAATIFPENAMRTVCVSSKKLQDGCQPKV